MEPITSLDDKRLGFSDASHGYEGILHESLKVAIARAEKAEGTYRSQEIALANLRTENRQIRDQLSGAKECLQAMERAVVKHDCPGFDCSVCSQPRYNMAEILR